MTQYFPPVVHGTDSGMGNGGMMLNRLDDLSRWLRGSSFHRAVLRTSDDPASPVIDYVTVLQQTPTCIVMVDYDMTLREIDPSHLHPVGV